MSGLRRQALKVLGDAIAARVKLPSPPTIVSAPPSKSAEYPAVALLMDEFDDKLNSEEELMVDSNGALMVGANASLDVGAGAAQVGQKSWLSSLGTLQGSGRIFLGTRLPGEREEYEYEITQLFFQDSIAAGTIYLQIDQPRVGKFVLPWKWTVAAYVERSKWTMEFAFDERLWAWLSFGIDVDILSIRHTERMTDIVAALNTALATDTDPATVIADPSTELWTVNIDGSLTKYQP